MGKSTISMAIFIVFCMFARGEIVTKASRIYKLATVESSKVSKTNEKNQLILLVTITCQEVGQLLHQHVNSREIGAIKKNRNA